MKQDKIKKLKANFIRLMYEKGYRGKFSLDWERERLTAKHYELPTCLEQIIKATQEQKAENNRFGLNTTTIGGIRCTFRGSFNEESGFRILEVAFEDKYSNEKKFFRLDDSYRIPGAASVATLFPKSKSRHNIIKGKFKL